MRHMAAPIYAGSSLAFVQGSLLASSLDLIFYGLLIFVLVNGLLNKE